MIRCLFEKSIQHGKCHCQFSETFYIAEREGVNCKSNDAQANCSAIIELLKENSKFALKTKGKEVLSFSLHQKIKTGGLLGISQVVNNVDETPTTIEDIAELINQAKSHFGQLEDLPFSRIIRVISSYKPRKKKRR
jgi:hypothetical protein